MFGTHSNRPQSNVCAHRTIAIWRGSKAHITTTSIRFFPFIRFSFLSFLLLLLVEGQSTLLLLLRFLIMYCLLYLICLFFHDRLLYNSNSMMLLDYDDDLFLANYLHTCFVTLTSCYVWSFLSMPYS